MYDNKQIVEALWGQALIYQPLPYTRLFFAFRFYFLKIGVKIWWTPEIKGLNFRGEQS